jgi:hypothetical protein
MILKGLQFDLFTKAVWTSALGFVDCRFFLLQAEQRVLLMRGTGEFPAADLHSKAL